jgi:mediator of RNA polymerase II transcription subunit 23
MNTLDSQKAFYQNQDPGSYTQLVLETAAIEILSLPASPAQVVSSLVQIVVHIQSSLIQSSGQTSGGPNVPAAGVTEQMGGGISSGINMAGLVSKSGYSSQQLSCLMIQACGLLLAQLPQEFHMQLYSEAARVIKECWWLADGSRPLKDLDSAVGYALLDPTWASQDNTSTAIGMVPFFLCLFF